VRSSAKLAARPALVVPSLVALALLGLVLLCVPRSAHAHDPFEITTDAHVSGEELRLHTTLSLLTATRACFDGPDAQRRLEPRDFESFRDAFDACARDYYRISSGGAVLPARSASARLGVEGDVELLAAYARPRVSPLLFEALPLRKLMARAGVVLTVTGARTFLGQKLLSPEDARFEIAITAEAEAPGTAPLPSLGRYLWLGVEHILSGADHLLFLLGLLVMCRSLRGVAVIVTCFTVAHSITLALAALDWVTISPRIVEPLIAASIVLVGLENLRRSAEPDGRWLGRWRIAFGFGLVHGLGFASALRQTGLGSHGSSVLGPIVAFNLGVELGQLSVAAALLAIIWNLPRTGRLVQLPRVASLLIAAVGAIWFVERVIS
jgi:hydrogenase/urease accessory protein HupE